MAKEPPPKDNEDPITPLPDFITSDPPPSRLPWPLPKPVPSEG